MGRPSAPPAFGERQVESAVRCHPRPAGRPAPTSPQTAGAGEGGGKRDPGALWRDCSLGQPLWAAVWGLPQKLKVQLLCDPVIALAEFPEKMTALTRKGAGSPVSRLNYLQQPDPRMS